MATVNLSSKFFNVLNTLFVSPDPIGALLGFSPDNLDGLTDALALLNGDLGDPTVISALPSRIEVAFPGPDASVFNLVVTGSGMGPLSSEDAFLEALENGTATGTLSGASLTQDGAEILALTPTTEGLRLTSGDQTINVNGTFSNRLADFGAYIALFDILDVDALAALTPAERSALIAGLSGVTLSGISLLDGADEVLTVSLTPTSLSVLTGGLNLVLTGTMPDSVGALVEDLLTAIDGGDDLLTGLLGVLALTELRVTDAVGDVVAVIDGALTDLSDLELIIDGIPVSTDTPLLFEAGEAGVNLTAEEESSMLIGTSVQDSLTGGVGDDTALGLDGDDVILGGAGNDHLKGHEAADRLLGEAGNDSLDGGIGADTLNGGDGDDTITGGPGDSDLRDVVYGGAGNDSVNAGAGNDLVYGQAGNDTIAGGFGVDELFGQGGDDVITGSAFSDLVFGGDGDDFVNGGFGFDRINGGDGGDKFFHAGVEGHGSDWIQDFVSADGDVLLFGIRSATADQFQVNYTHTSSPDGERSGDDDVEEAFVIYKPTGQIIWALVDGAGQEEINLQIAISTDTFDIA